MSGTTVQAPPGSLLPGGFLSTSGNQIVDSNGTPVKIAAINWFGLEGTSYAPGGLNVVSYESIMDAMKNAGFNTIRLPFSLQLFDAGSTPGGIDYSVNPDLQGLNGLGIMDKIVAYAGQIGMKIILDDHRSSAGPGPNSDGLWYDSNYSEQQWINTWAMLAQHYANNSTIIGADLSNEPFNGTWGDGSSTDWAAAATRAGDAIQKVNPNWLMIVEGIAQYDGSWGWNGGNLMGVAQHPVTLTVPNKVVYSPHDYPASVYDQPWFQDPNYPNNLPSVWTQYWGYIYQQNIAPVLLGEFGTKLATTSDQQWLTKLVAYLNGDFTGTGTSSIPPSQQGISWAYWDWNPNSGDTGGIVEDDWKTTDDAKLDAIEPAMYHPDVPCFAAGTLIATQRGNVAVEDLVLGDMVKTVLPANGAQKIVWIGRRRIKLKNHPNPNHVQPIRILAGAFGPDLPRRDLRLSPDHAVYSAGVLIPARLLVNGATVLRESAAEVDYIHIELEQHAVLLSEGLPTESYLEEGNRGLFANTSGPVSLFTHFTPDPDALRCAPLVQGGDKLARVQDGLAQRAEELGLYRTMAPDLRLLVDGAVVGPSQRMGKDHIFYLPHGARSLRLLSRAAIPADLDPFSEDTRRLGVCIDRIEVTENGRRRHILPDDPALTDGWHAVEGGLNTSWRWTNGNGDLALTLRPGASIVIPSVGSLLFWVCPDDRRLAASA
jgi:aryl-phospho-beta-D-glucosidase BglC (GH1 family)